MSARRKGWDLRNVKVHLDHGKRYVDDCMACESKGVKLDYFDRIIELEGDLTEEQRSRLLEIVNKCPVHRTMENEIRVNTRLNTST